VCSLLVLAFYFLPERAGVATSLLHVEALGYEGYGRSTVVGFSRDYIISWMWSVLRQAISTKFLTDSKEDSIYSVFSLFNALA